MPVRQGRLSADRRLAGAGGADRAGRDAAEARHTGGYCRDGAARDLRYARRLALQRATPKTLDRFERRMLAKVENLLADEGHWRAVELIAAVLMKQGTISGRAARHLFEQGCR